MEHRRIPHRWLVAFLAARALATVVIGLVLLLWPSDAVRTLARALGWVLLVIGAVDLVGGAVRRIPRAVRGLVLGRGLLTVVLGGVLVVLTDASLTVVAILAGMQLVVGGGVSVLLGVWASDDEPAAVRGVVVRGALTVLFGAALIAWPDKSVTAVAIALGIQWVVTGLVSTVVAVVLGLRRSPQRVRGETMVVDS